MLSADDRSGRLPHGWGFRPGHVFDSFYFYPINNESDLVRTYSESANAVRYSTVLDQVARKRLWAATVQPRFDDTPIVNDPVTPFCGGTPKIIDRDNGNFYRSTWDAAIASRPDWIFVTAWNEYQENTQIEPSTFYGDEYLVLTREYVKTWKLQPCPQP